MTRAAKKTAKRPGAAKKAKPKPTPASKAAPARRPPTGRTPEQARRICDAIANGATLSSLDGKPGFMARSAILNWLAEDAMFRDQYEAARIARADARAERIDAIVDKVLKRRIDPQSARVAIDAEKWQAGKENTKRYGDRIDVTADVNVRALSDDELDAKIAERAAAAGLAITGRDRASED